MTGKTSKGFITLFFIILITALLLPAGYRNRSRYRVQTHDGLPLLWELSLPDSVAPCPALLFLHGNRANLRNYELYRHAALQNGMAFASYDARGHGGSGGTNIGSQEQRTRDAECILDQLLSNPRINPQRITISGHSMGANTSYRVGFSRSEPESITTVAGKFYPRKNQRLKNNLLVMTGADDPLVPPKWPQRVADAEHGSHVERDKLYGSFADKTAMELYIAPNANHATECFSRPLADKLISWALQSKSTSPVSPVTQWGLLRLGMVFTAWLILLALLKQLASGPRRLLLLVLLTWLLMQLSICRDFYYLGPHTTKLSQYVILLAFALPAVLFGSLLSKGLPRWLPIGDLLSLSILFGSAIGLTLHLSGEMCMFWRESAVPFAAGLLILNLLIGLFRYKAWESITATALFFCLLYPAIFPAFH